MALVGLKAGVAIFGIASQPFGHEEPSLSEEKRTPAEGKPDPESQNGLASVPSPNREKSDMGSALLNDLCSNPFLVTCNQPLPHSDHTGYVRPHIDGEVLAYRQLRKIISQHKDWTVSEVEEELANHLYTEDRRERMLVMFQTTQNAIKKLISEEWSQHLSEEEVKILLSRINSVILETPPPASLYSDSPEVITKNSMYYERTREGVLKIRYGGAFLLNITSWYNIVFSLAHELAHAIDPCELNVTKARPVSYQGLTACFLNNGWLAEHETLCDPNDKLSEVFADWVATEVMATVLPDQIENLTPKAIAKGAINMTRDLCKRSDSVDRFVFHHHPRPDLRINEIIWTQNRFRRALGCKTDSKKSQCHMGDQDNLGDSK